MSLPLIVHSPSSTALLVGVSAMALPASSNTLAETHPIAPPGDAPVPGTYCFMAASHSATPGWLGGVSRTLEASQAPSIPSPGLAAAKATPLLMIGTSRPTLLHDRLTREAAESTIPSASAWAPAFLAWTQAEV